MSAPPNLSGNAVASSPFYNAPILMSVGGWIPEDPKPLNDWLQKKLDQVKNAPRKEDDETIRQFRRFIRDNAEVFMGFHRIFEGVPNADPMGNTQVKDYNTMLDLFNIFLQEAPEYDEDFLVFLPFTAVLQWPMSMSNGFTILINSQVNDHFRQIFGVWSQFLSSSQSRSVLNETDKGWLGSKAMAQMPNFRTTFVCDPRQAHWGFQSWDDFFARRLRQGARPVASPGDSTVITSACESKVLRIAYNVQELDQFWLKGQPYSLIHMLNNRPEASSFIGGTVYQAFLSPFYYHRWSSPVDGVVQAFQLVPGTYFAGIPSDEPPPPPDFAFQGQQPFLTHVATRALIFIQADDPNIGLVCFIGVGMVEVSSCDITVIEGQRVKKGDEIGTFHFGGSTHCLVFGPKTGLNFRVSPKEFVQVHQAIADLK